MVAIDSDMSHPEELALSNVSGKAWSGKDRVDLRVVEAQGGDRIALWVNVQDNRALDSERGPQKSRSEVIYLEIDSPEWEHRALIDALREHMEAHLAALADRLEVGFVLIDYK